VGSLERAIRLLEFRGFKADNLMAAKWAAAVQEIRILADD